MADNNQVKLETMCVDLQAVIDMPNTFPLAKKLAKKLQENMYLSLADYLIGLTVDEISSLSLMVELSNTNTDVLQELLLIAAMLSHAEGCYELDDITLTNNIQFFCLLITCESLSRKGIAELIYKNISFDKEFRLLEIIKLNDKFTGM